MKHFSLILVVITLFSLTSVYAQDANLAQNSNAQDSVVQDNDTKAEGQTNSLENNEVAVQSASDKPLNNNVVENKSLNSERSVTSADRTSAGLGLGKMAFSLIIVVGIVIALGWAFKKLTLRMPGGRHIKIITTMPLGPKERLLVIEIQGKQRVLGVTSSNINFLFELENSLPEEKLASDFHAQFQSYLKK